MMAPVVPGRNPPLGGIVGNHPPPDKMGAPGMYCSAYRVKPFEIKADNPHVKATTTRKLPVGALRGNFERKDVKA